MTKQNEHLVNKIMEILVSVRESGGEGWSDELGEIEYLYELYRPDLHVKIINSGD